MSEYVPEPIVDEEESQEGKDGGRRGFLKWLGLVLGGSMVIKSAPDGVDHLVARYEKYKEDWFKEE
jgi:hypothetical protein